MLVGRAIVCIRVQDELIDFIFSSGKIRRGPFFTVKI
jgi:hypothetical protein